MSTDLVIPALEGEIQFAPVLRWDAEAIRTQADQIGDSDEPQPDGTFAEIDLDLATPLAEWNPYGSDDCARDLNGYLSSLHTRGLAHIVHPLVTGLDFQDTGDELAYVDIAVLVGNPGRQALQVATYRWMHIAAFTQRGNVHGADALISALQTINRYASEAIHDLTHFVKAAA